MKLQCDLCREIVVADFTVTGGAIEVHCPACRKSFVVNATRGGADAPAPAARATGPMTCPKCGDAQPAAAACRSCGLLAERMADFARADAEVAPEVDAAWSAAVAAWSDIAAHDRFHAAAAAGSAFAWAAQRYRDRLRADPADTVAAEQLARLARTAEVTLFATATRKPERKAKPFRGAIGVLAVLAVLLIIGVGFAMLASGMREDSGAPVPPKAARPAKPAR